MSYDTGDIVIFDGSPGHVGMIYEPKAGSSPAKLIHARMKTDFAIDDLETENAGVINQLISNNASVFSPPWSKCSDKAGKQRELKRIADAIKTHAKYGAGRAIRLFAGSSIFGPKAAARLQKYRDRSLNNFMDSSGKSKFVSTITCSEAIILCYQLTFADGTEPFFIRLDAAHTMPSTLKEYLTTHWGAAERG